MMKVPTAAVAPEPAPHPTKISDTTRIVVAVGSLYKEADVPAPSVSYPIAPLGPLLDVLPLVCRELPSLTSREAEIYLLRRGSLSEPFASGIATDEVLSGFLYAGANQSFVFLRGGDPVVRRRFSLAHELGHLVLHLSRWLEGSSAPEAEFHDLFTPEQADMGAGGGATTFALREREADAFAAELLMPEDVVRSLSTVACRDGFFGIGLAERVAVTLLVSRAAMWKRLCHLGIVSEGTNAILPTEPAD